MIRRQSKVDQSQTQPPTNGKWCRRLRHARHRPPTLSNCSQLARGLPVPSVLSIFLSLSLSSIMRSLNDCNWLIIATVLTPPIECYAVSTFHRASSRRDNVHMCMSRNNAAVYAAASIRWNDNQSVLHINIRYTVYAINIYSSTIFTLLVHTIRRYN